MGRAVTAGYLSLPVLLQEGSLSDVMHTQAMPSSSGTRLLFVKEQTAAAVSDATLVATALSNCTDQAAHLTWGFAAIEDLLRGSGCSSNDGRMLQCRTRMKALHLLLQSNTIQLQAVGVSANTCPQSQQQQRQQQEAESALVPAFQSSCSQSCMELATAAASAQVGPSQASRKQSKKSRQIQSSMISGLPTCSGWLTVAVVLLPDFFYQPSLAEAAPGLDTNNCNMTCDPMSWTSLPDFDISDQQHAKAVNTLMTMMLELTTLTQQQQGHADKDTDTDDEYKQVINGCRVPQQAGCAEVRTSAAAAAAVSPDQFKRQFQLYSCPDAAAAASSDVRQSLFDWVDSSAWHHEAVDPPGLTNKLYRYQRRALAWMIWRETHGRQHMRDSSSTGGPHLPVPGPSASADHCCVCSSSLGPSSPNVLAAQGLLGCQLLNPLWSEVTLNITQPPSLAVTAAGASAAANCHCQGTSMSLQQQHSLPPCPLHVASRASVTLYHAVSSGLVSSVKPAQFCGPAGGLLADEMGLGKTVEVLALLLARPPPPGVKGTRRTTSATVAFAEGDDHGDDEDDDDEYIWMAGFKRPRSKPQQQRRHLQQAQLLHHEPAGAFDTNHLHSQSQAGHDGAGLSPGTPSGPCWPVAGKWAGGTLVVAPPAILQQWVSEAQRHAPGLAVEVYEGLKWQRAQQEAEQRKKQARQSKGARAQQALLEQYNYAVNGPPDDPVFDADQEAADAVKQLLRADLIITTFDVLRQEVHFSGGDADRLSSLRHKKRYSVPQSPLLQVDWWRLVLDEAQLVGGGLSSTAVMAGHITARHRWAVTGTPIGPGGLDDVGNLLRLIGAAPFDTPHTFRKAIQEPFAASVAAAIAAVEDRDQQQHHLLSEGAVLDVGDKDMSSEQHPVVPVPCPRRYGPVERDGVRRLIALLQPLMWRSNKEAAAADHPLPPRHLQCALLRFSPAERSFYNHILEKTAAANKELQQKQEEAAAAADQQQQQGAGAEVANTTGMQQKQKQQRRGRHRRSRSSQYEDQLQQLAAGQILQLRLACIHPQLTSYWRELSSELQLRQGGALSIAEIMTRMKDGAQLKLQQAERELCVTLNVLADKLVKQAQEAEVAAVAAAAGSGGQSGASNARQGKKRGRHSSGAAGSSAHSSAVAAAAVSADVAGSEVDDDDDTYEPGGKRRDSGGSRGRKRVRFATDDDAVLAVADAAANDQDALESEAAAAGGAGSSSSSGRRGVSSGGSDAVIIPPADLKAAALELLEDSYKVGEYGIAALTDSSNNNSNDPEPLTDIAGGDATWRAWKHVGLHTAQSLSRLCAELGMSIKSELYGSDVARKRTELLETVTAEVTRAELKHNTHKRKVEELAAELAAAWAAAGADGVPMAEMTGCPDASSWLSELSSSITAAKAAEVTQRQHQSDDQGAVTRVTTVLLGHEVTKVLETAEATAAADRALLEGIVGQVHIRKVVGLLSTLLSSASATRCNKGLKDGANRNNRKAAAAGGRQGVAAADSELDSDLDDDHSSEDEQDFSSLAGRGRKGPTAVGFSAVDQATAADLLLTKGVDAWAAGSNMQAHQAAAAAGIDVNSFKVAAARAATHQFLDCLPERRAVWRLMYRGSLGVAGEGSGVQADGGAAAPWESGNSSSKSSSSSSVMLATPDSAAAALGGLLQVYAATAFTSSSIAASSQQQLSTAAAATGQVASSAAGVFESQVLRNAADSHVRQLLRRLYKREAGFIRAVDAAVAAASGGDNPAAAERLVAAYLLQQQRKQAQVQQQSGSPESSAVLDEAEISIRDVNVPILLHQLPLSAVAAAADAARVRIDVCRAHRDVYVSDLGLEVANHNRQLVEEEADMAAAGNNTQVIQLADKSEAELRKTVSDLTKKCDELLRHKRFLANQAAESTHLAQLGRKKRRSPDADHDHDGDPGDGADGAEAEKDEDDEADDLECAVCRSAMSDELQVFSCGHYFCDSCAAVQLAQPSPSCAYCRARVTKNGVFRVSLAGSGGHEPEVDPPEGQAVRDIKVTGVWMTKLEALLRRVLLMRETDAGSKALVFSQFPDALVLASKALDVMKVKHVSLGLGGGKDRRMAMRAAVKSFNEDPEVCIFLLSLRAGSSGLTLTAANRVFLLEPGVDPAIEQQAVARVHRIGQEKEVLITRLLLQGTVEEQVLKISEDKQLLLTEAAQHHQQVYSQTQQHKQPDKAQAGQHEAEESADEDDGDEMDWVAPASVMMTPRRRSASTWSHPGPGNIGDTTAPTTLQALAPKRERVGGGEAVGLLAAVMQQARQQLEQ